MLSNHLLSYSFPSPCDTRMTEYNHVPIVDKYRQK